MIMMIFCSHQMAAELVRVTAPNGRLLVYAWAKEQTETSKRQFDTQDCFVPWHMPTHFTDAHSNNNAGGNSYVVLQRYCHVFVQGELEELFQFPNVRVLQSFYDHANWCVLLTKDK
jgi:hypothetical protein